MRARVWLLGLWLSVGCAEAEPPPIPASGGNDDDEETAEDHSVMGGLRASGERYDIGLADDAGAGTAGAFAGPDATVPPALDAGVLNPGDLGSDVFDPGRVYLAGTLEEGLCGREAIARIEEPDRGVVGFDCYFDGASAQIDTVTGRLLYMNTFEELLREFSCDRGCSELVAAADYPDAPLANDRVLDTPPCTPDGDPLERALLSPDGSRVHRCRSGAPWYDEAGNVAYAGALELEHLSSSHLAFAGTHLVDLVSGTEIPIVGLPAGGARAVRAGELGFLVVSDGAAGAAEPELWEVGPDGNANLRGAYPPAPDGEPQGVQIAIDADGALYQVGSSMLADLIVRRTIEGDSAVVYSEAEQPRVKIHASRFVTGP